VLVDRLDSRSLGADLERSARVRWRGGEERLFLRVPAELAAPGDDATFFLCALLLPAMRLHEDLEIDAPVSARVLARQERIQRTWHAWDQSVRRCEVSAAGTMPPPERRGADVASLFSRGVDSTYSAVVSREEPGPLTRLVYVDGIEPLHGDEVRREEIRLVREAAEAVGLPLSVCSANVRTLTDGLLSWGDAHGGFLAGLAGALGGGLRHLVIPSTHTRTGLGPYGSHPLIDPLFSTEAVEIEHDEVVGRTGKVFLLAEERPDLLPLLKVCFTEDGNGNCGRCSKCLLTMAALQAAGALELATGFPDEVDAALIAEVRQEGFSLRTDWVELARALPEGPVQAAVLRSLRRSRGPHVLRRPWSASPDQFTRHRVNTAIALLFDGRPYP